MDKNKKSLIYDLSNKKITSIEVDTFNLSPQLLKLDLSLNWLGVLCAKENQFCPALPPYVFEHLNNLIVLDLSGNWLHDLHRRIFNGLLNLGYLNLKNNCLTKLHKELFDDMPKLNRLNLDGNKLKILPGEKDPKDRPLSWYLLPWNGLRQWTPDDLQLKDRDPTDFSSFTSIVEMKAQKNRRSHFYP